MNILILGKNGQVGRSLIDELKFTDIRYIALSQQELDLTSEIDVSNYFLENKGFNFIINCAAYTAVDLAEKEEEKANSVNHLAIVYLAKQCKLYDVPIIHLSTDYVFSGNKPIPYNEDDIPAPAGAYARSKLEGEKALQDIFDKHIILRVCWVFSNYRKNFLKTLIALSTEKNCLKIVADQYGSPTSACSIAKVIIQIINFQAINSDINNNWGIYHYSDFPATNWHQFATYVIHTYRCRERTIKLKELIPIETKDYPTLALRPKNSVLNINKIQSTFNIEQSSWMDQVKCILK